MLGPTGKDGDTMHEDGLFHIFGLVSSVLAVGGALVWQRMAMRKERDREQAVLLGRSFDAYAAVDPVLRGFKTFLRRLVASYAVVMPPVFGAVFFTSAAQTGVTGTIVFVVFLLAGMSAIAGLVGVPMAGDRCLTLASALGVVGGRLFILFDMGTMRLIEPEKIIQAKVYSPPRFRFFMLCGGEITVANGGLWRARTLILVPSSLAFRSMLALLRGQEPEPLLQEAWRASVLCQPTRRVEHGYSPSLWPVYVPAATMVVSSLFLLVVTMVSAHAPAVEQSAVAAHVLFALITAWGLIGLRPWAWWCAVAWAISLGWAATPALRIVRALSSERAAEHLGWMLLPMGCMMVVLAVLGLVGWALLTRRPLFFPSDR